MWVSLFIHFFFRRRGIYAYIRFVKTGWENERTGGGMREKKLNLMDWLAVVFFWGGWICLEANGGGGFVGVVVLFYYLTRGGHRHIRHARGNCVYI
jgi:hypothetical protein